MDALLGVGIRVNSVDLCRAPAISGLTPTADTSTSAGFCRHGHV